MIRRTLPLLCLLAAGAAPAASFASTGEFTHEQAKRALREARQAISFEASIVEARDATIALRDLAVALPALRGAERRQAESILARPTDPDDREYFGPEADDSPICNDRFCVHWTDQGQNAPDSDEFIQQVVDATNQAYAIENTALGWRPPKPDGSRGARGAVGGEGQTDVYLTNLGRRLFGFAAPDPGQEGSQRHAYLVLDNNFLGFPSPPLESMQVTVAHEYNHVLQFNYDTLQDLWMFEASATWIEEKVYPDINDYLNFLPPFAKLPQAPLTGKDKIYGDSVFNHWLESRYGPDVVREAWGSSLQAKPKHLATAAYDEAIREAGGKSFTREFAAFAPVTAEWRSSPIFPDSARYPEVRRRGKLDRKRSEVVLDNTSYELTTVKNPGATVILKVKAERGIRSSIALVGREGAGGEDVTIESRYLARGGTARVKLTGAAAYERVTAVIVNADGRRGKRGDYRGDGAVYKASLAG